MNKKKRAFILKAQKELNDYNIEIKQGRAREIIFTLPSLDELINLERYSKKSEDNYMCSTIQDIRYALINKCRVSRDLIEVLFSKTLALNAELSDESMVLTSQLYNMREDIIQMNLPHFYYSTIGLYHSKINEIIAETKTQPLKKDYAGYDLSVAVEALQLLDSLRRYAKEDYKDYEKAIWYEETNPMRELFRLTAIGSFEVSDFLNISDAILNSVTDGYKDGYISKPINLHTYNELTDVIKKLIKLNI